MKKLEVTITYMERFGDEPVPSSEVPLSMVLRHEEHASWELYRDFYYGVGYANFWWERRLWTEEQWFVLQNDSSVELFCLYENEKPAGYFELNFAKLPESAELSFFGLYPNYIGKGIGKMLLVQALLRLQSRSPKMMLVNTCDLDHPSAKPLYESFGFRRCKTVKQIIADPREQGILGKDLSLPKHYKGSKK